MFYQPFWLVNNVKLLLKMEVLLYFFTISNKVEAGKTKTAKTNSMLNWLNLTIFQNMFFLYFPTYQVFWIYTQC